MPAISLSVMRLTPACLERWRQESDGRVQHGNDGELRHDQVGYAHVFENGRLRICGGRPNLVALGG